MWEGRRPASPVTNYDIHLIGALRSVYEFWRMVFVCMAMVIVALVRIEDSIIW